MKGRELGQSVGSHVVDILHCDAKWGILHRWIFVLPKRAVSQVISPLRSILCGLILSSGLLNSVSNLLNLLIFILSGLIVLTLLWDFHCHKSTSLSSPTKHVTPDPTRENEKNKNKLENLLIELVLENKNKNQNKKKKKK